MLLVIDSSTHQFKSQDRTSVDKFSLCEPLLSFEETTQEIRLCCPLCSWHPCSIYKALRSHCFKRIHQNYFTSERLKAYCVKEANTAVEHIINRGQVPDCTDLRVSNSDRPKGQNPL